MATLAADAVRTYAIGEMEDYPAIAADIIYEGAAVGDDGNGYARPLQAGDPFRGFAVERCDNAAGAAGDKTVRCRTEGRIVLAIGSLAITDVGKAVYASDDNTFTLTQSTNTLIGFVDQYLASGSGIVRFRSQNGAVAELTDSSGGTANDTVAAVGATNSGDVSATINSNFADLAAKVNYLLRRQGH